MDHRRLWNGLLLVLVGLFLLAYNQGWLNTSLLRNYLTDWWPVALIVLGVIVLLTGRGPSAGIVILCAIVIGAVVMGNSLFWLNPGRWSLENRTRNTASFRQDAQPGVTTSSIMVDFGAGSLEVRGGSSGLADATLDYFEVKPEWTVDVSGNTATIRARQSRDERLPVNNPTYKWQLNLSNAVTTDLSVSAGACSGDLDLSSVKLRNLSLNTGASSLKVRFPAETSMRATINSGASSLDFYVPAGVGIRVNASNPIVHGALEREGLIKQGNTFTSKDFGSARANLEIDLSVGASSVKFHR